MANIFVKIFGKVYDILSYPFTHAAKMAHILSVTGKDVPELKDCIVGLVEEGEKVGADALLAIGQKGVNLPEDLETLKEAQAFFAYFKTTFLPQVEQIYADLIGAAKTPEPPTAPVAQQEAAPAPASTAPAREANSGLAPA